VRDPTLGRLDVEHPAAAGVHAVGRVVRTERARRVGIPLEPERDRAFPGRAADLLVVRPAAVLHSLGLHVSLGAAGARQALAEVLTGREGSCVDLHLEVALVLVPVADLDRECQQEQDERHQQADEGDHASVLRA